MPTLPRNPYPGLPKAMTLLVVEDESRLRELLLDMAPEAGFTATGARTAEEALRLMEAHPREVVILDLNLPAMEGMEFFRVLRDRWPESEVIILTGFGGLDSARKAIHLDAVEFLTKPCPLDQIEKALDRARRRIDTDRLARVTAPAERSTAPAPVPSETLAECERRLIEATLVRHGGNRTAAATALGISRRTLHYRLAEYAQMDQAG